MEAANPKGLSKDDSLVIKGVAILAMMWNHCFLEGRFESFDLSFFPLGQGRVAGIAAFLKICVSLFAFVSGYGLYCSLGSLERREGDFSWRSIGSWYRIRYIRSFSGFWIIVVLAWIVCQLIDGHTVEVYFHDSITSGVFYMLLQITGLSSFFGAPSLIATWWYMSAALVFIVLAPLLYVLIKRFGGVLCVGLVFIVARVTGGYPGGVSYLTFLAAFAVGMLCAHHDVFARVKEFGESSKRSGTVLVVGLILATLICYKVDKSLSTKLFWDVKWGLFIPVYVMLVICCLARIPVLNKTLAFLGSWSADIFLIHSFFRARYAIDIVYAPGNFLFVILRLLALALVACMLLRGIKKLIRYDDLTVWLQRICA